MCVVITEKKRICIHLSQSKGRKRNDGGRDPVYVDDY